jgi:hypothetical protein
LQDVSFLCFLKKNKITMKCFFAFSSSSSLLLLLLLALIMLTMSSARSIGSSSSNRRSYFKSNNAPSKRTMMAGRSSSIHLLRGGGSEKDRSVVVVESTKGQASVDIKEKKEVATTPTPPPTPTTPRRRRRRRIKRTKRRVPSSEIEIDEDSEEEEEESGKDKPLRVTVVTFNLAESTKVFPTTNDKNNDGSNNPYFMERLGVDSDVIFIGAQETEPLKPRRSEGSRSRQWRSLLVKSLVLSSSSQLQQQWQQRERDFGSEEGGVLPRRVKERRLSSADTFVPLAFHAIGGVQGALFVRKRLMSKVSIVRVKDVALGVGNVFHNKAAIGVFLRIDDRDMCFITAHLAAHMKNVKERLGDYERIMDELEGAIPIPMMTMNGNGRDVDDKSSISSDGFNDAAAAGSLIDDMDNVFLCGDLNFRLEMSREAAEFAAVYTKDVKKLLKHDQLLKECAKRTIAVGLTEGEITFLPTYKFDKGSNVYDSSVKERVPAYTDRVLYKPGENIEIIKYDTVFDEIGSDHRPVYARFLCYSSSSSTRHGKSPSVRSALH